MVSKSIWLFIIVVILAQGISGDEIRLDQSPAEIKRPGETVKISCKISGFTMTSYYMHWIRQKPGKALEWIGRVNSGSVIYAETMKNHFTLSEDVSQSTQYLEAKSLREEDTAVYYCARDPGGGDFDYWGKGTKVTVSSAESSAPKSIFAMSQCTSDPDGFLTIGCMARGFSPADSLTFKWTDSSTVLSDVVQYPAFGGNGEYTKISHLRVRKSDLDPKKPYKCEASNSKGTIDTVVPKTPPPPPPDVRATVYLTVPTKMELDNGTATFMCLAQRFSPKTYKFKWSLDGKEETNVIDTYDKSEKKGSVTEYSATSILQISANDWKKQTSKIKCEFDHKAGNEEKEAEYAVPIQECSDVAVDIVPPSLEAMLKNRTGVLKCKSSAENSGFGKITITANNNVIAETKVQDDYKELKLELDVPIGYEEWSNGTEFTCTVEHSELAGPKMTTFVRENGKNPKKPTVFVLAPPEHKPDEPMTLTCYVKDFYPKEVFVSWLADDEPVTSKYSTSLPIQKDKFFSVYSQLTVNDSKWKNGTMFSCVVYHEGIDEKMRVLTRSINDNTEKAGVINLSMNTPACCKA